MRKTRGLVITAFDDAGQRVQAEVRHALEDLGVDVLRFDSVTPGAAWGSTITDAVRSSDIVVVDVSQQNPNVFYELGMAHALRRPTILIASTKGMRSLPSDLMDFHYIVYDPKNLQALVKTLQLAAQSLIQRGEDKQ